MSKMVAHASVLEAIPALSPDDVRMGKDVLELVSTAMYVDPMSVYREYIQNAADAVDDAKTFGFLSAGERGVIDIMIDSITRTIRIRDNGSGVSPDTFPVQMAALGGSLKRGSTARGFRGVGRLSGLGYAQELVFRSRFEGQKDISEIRWDCRRLKAALSDRSFKGSVSDLVSRIVTVTRRPADDYPLRFFEVELVKVIRQRNDKLMDLATVAEYLSQVAPVPFAPHFGFGGEIVEHIRSVAALTELNIRINGSEPISRPHQNFVDVGGKPSAFENLNVVEVPGQDGGIAALGWFLHHGYEGALSTNTLVKGVRIRVGNLQVGDNTILEEIFPEVRFNAWSVGEIHILDSRIVPNGRRDHFEQNAHFSNLLNKLSPCARDITRRCRTNSVRRSKLREFELSSADVQGRIDILRQNSLDPTGRGSTVAAAETALLKMEKLSGLNLLTDDNPDVLRHRVERLRTDLSAASELRPARNPFDHLPVLEKTIYERVFSLIYECSVNRVTAKNLIDRILEKVTQI